MFLYCLYAGIMQLLVALFLFTDASADRHFHYVFYWICMFYYSQMKKLIFYYTELSTAQSSFCIHVQRPVRLVS
jgi:hypothetical protein